MTKASRATKAEVAERKKSVVNLIMEGVAPTAASAAVGVPNSNRLVNSSDVREALEKARKELADATNIKRGDIVAGMLDAIEMAKLAADPGAMIRGYAEIAKMLGLYAPEVKKLEITTSQAALVSQYEAMSDAELLAKLEAKTVEGVFDRVDDDA